MVKKVFLEKFAKREELQDVIQEARNASLNEQDLFGSSDRLDALYISAGFNEEAKFGLLRMEVR